LHPFSVDGPCYDILSPVFLHNSIDYGNKKIILDNGKSFLIFKIKYIIYFIKYIDFGCPST